MASMTGLDIVLERKAFAATATTPERVVYADFRLSVAPGGFVALIGPSGCGKTTLLNIVAGIDRAYSGRVRSTGGTAAGEAPPTPRLAYVFQSPRLLPWRTVAENVRLALTAEQIARGLDERFIDLVGLAESRGLHPERLSLGMQRRAALARAFATEPDVLLMDEPFVSLDEATAERLRLLLLDLLAARPATVLFVTHDTREATMLADRVVEIAGAPAAIVRDVTVPLTSAARRDAADVADAHAALFSPPTPAAPVAGAAASSRLGTTAGPGPGR